jgi:hypothetical protein
VIHRDAPSKFFLCRLWAIECSHQGGVAE